MEDGHFAWVYFTTTKDAYFTKDELKTLQSNKLYYYCDLPPSAFPWVVMTFTKEKVWEV